jgi:hypothetical protein
MPDISVTGLDAKREEKVELDDLRDGTPGLAAPATSARKPFWTAELVKPALVKARGIVTEAARILSEAYDRPCTPETIRKLVKSNAELDEVCRESRAKVLEECFAARVAMAEAGDERAQEFLLKAYDPRFRNKTEVPGPGGGPIQVEHEIPLRLGDQVFKDLVEEKFTHDELVELSEIAEIVDRRGGFDQLTGAEFLRMKELQDKGRRREIEGDQLA